MLQTTRCVKDPVTNTEQQTLESATRSTVRITSNYDVRDKFNPQEIDSQGKSIGSGFFIDTDGHILTCNHVVTNSKKIFINLPDGGKKSYKARIISLYPELDIAVLKIHGYQNKHFIKMGTSDMCKMGEDTVAIGYPLGDDTVKTTKGTISGKKNFLIQTDTTINSGSSGGPLLNSRYEVIGINSSKAIGYSTEGTSYIVPIDIFKTVMYQMIDQNSINNKTSPVDDQEKESIQLIYKPNLYCDFQSLEFDTIVLLCHKYIAQNTQHDAQSIEGYMIIWIHKLSPLAVCENPMKVYDILMEFDEKKIDCFGDIDVDCNLGKLSLDSYIIKCKANQKIKIKYFSVKTQSIVDTIITMKNEYLYQVPEVFYPQQYNYLNIDGVVICQLTLDHIMDIVNSEYPASMACQATMYKYILPEHREEPKIFISRILPGSSRIDSKNLENSEGCVIVRANGMNVLTIDQFKSICKNNPIVVNGNYYVHLEMSNRENITLCITEQ